MRVFDISTKLFHTVDKKELMTDSMYIVTEAEENQITNVINSDGVVYVENNILKWSSRPDYDYDWNEETKEWVINETVHSEKLEKERNEIWEKIKLYRLDKEQSGCYVEALEKWFHTDSGTQMKYALLGLATQSSFFQPVQWKTMDGSYVELNKDNYTDILAALLNQASAIHIVAETHKAALWESEEPYSYDFTTGWPATYE